MSVWRAPTSSVLKRTQLGQSLTRSRGQKGWGWYSRSLREAEQEKPQAKTYDHAAKAFNFPGSKTKAFFQISIDNDSVGKVVFELRDDVNPNTVKNFVMLCEGHKTGGLTYKGSTFHRIQRGRVISGGEVETNGDRCGHSALGSRYFNDESFVLHHSEPGVLSMCNSGVHRNASQFLITTSPQPNLDGRNVAFGKVVQGMDVVKKVEEVYAVKGKPVPKIVIEDCGLLAA